MLLGEGRDAKLADAGLAAFMHHDYMAAKSNLGRFIWTVRIRAASDFLLLHCLPVLLPAASRPARPLPPADYGREA